MNRIGENLLSARSAGFLKRLKASSASKTDQYRQCCSRRAGILRIASPCFSKLLNTRGVLNNCVSPEEHVRSTLAFWDNCQEVTPFAGRKSRTPRNGVALEIRRNVTCAVPGEM